MLTMMTAEAAAADPERSTMPKVVRTTDEKRLDKSEQDRRRYAALTPAKKEEVRARTKTRNAGYNQVLKNLKAPCIRIEPPIKGSCRVADVLQGPSAR